MLRRLESRGLDVSNVQVDTGGIPTGFVVVTMQGAMPSYDIVQPSAWDAMAVTDDLIEAATGAVVVYGSLAQRDERSASAIDAASKVASKRVFDINLRKPFIDEELCVRHARECWLLKLNDDELPEMYAWLNLSSGEEDDVSQDDMARSVRDALNCEMLCLTRGGDGAADVAEAVGREILVGSGALPSQELMHASRGPPFREEVGSKSDFISDLSSTTPA